MELQHPVFMAEKQHGRPQEGNAVLHGSEALFNTNIKGVDLNGNPLLPEMTAEPPLKRSRPDCATPTCTQTCTTTENVPWVYEELPLPGVPSAHNVTFYPTGGPSPSIPAEYQVCGNTHTPQRTTEQSKIGPATSVPQFSAAAITQTLPNEKKSSISTNSDAPFRVQKVLPMDTEKEGVNNTAAPTPVPVKVEPEQLAAVKMSDAQSSDTAKESVDDHKPNLPFDDDDPFASLDWKDGVATLPGSNLKFKLTEFGTLEIVSTVETDKGECEWSTKTEHHAPGKVANGAKSTSTGKLAATTVKSELMDGPPESGNILCCEVCGKYGLPQDFSASGRFCSLSCVGAYTGRRNKGREFTRHVTTSDGKVIRKRRKGKGKKATGKQVLNTASSAEMDGEHIGGSQAVIAPKGKPGVKGEKRIRTKNVIPLEGVGTSLTAASVPYSFTQPFIWSEYLYSTGTKQAPVSVFKQENSDRDVFPMPSSEFRKGMKVEAIDPKHPPYICVCTIVRVKGCRLRLHFDGWSESYDFWTNVDSPFIFPVGWCEKNGQTLHPPRSMIKGDFNWDKYLKKQGARGAPEHAFQPTPTTQHGFKAGMKLEAVDRKNPDLICVATVTNVIGSRFLVHFDEWEDTYDYWCEDSCPYIHPVGWCAENGKRLNPPDDDEVDTFNWEHYLKSTGSVAAPAEIFKTRSPPGFKRGQKLEAVDKRNPSLVRAATVAETEEYRVRIHFDGWDDIYDDWFDADSLELHPVGWCAKTRHTLEPPLTTAEKISSAACPTPGCKGIGHVKGAKYSTHHSTFGCPYSLQNLNKDSCLVDRLSPNSMSEESDWSYASKNKATDGRSRGSRDDPNSPAEWICPTKGCDGTGHVTGQWRTHHSVSGCPLNEANFVKIGKYVPRSPAPTTKKTASVITSTARVTDKNTKTPGGSIINTRSSAKRTTPDERREKMSDSYQTFSAPLYHEKAVQHVSLSTVSWPSIGHSQVQDLSSMEGPESRERQRISKWSVDTVANHIKSLGCMDQARIFAEQQIDGEAFLLLTQTDIVDILKIKLGPALKIFKSIPMQY